MWTVFNYRRARRAEAARWLQVFRDFYLEDRFRDIKLVMEYRYETQLGPLLERRVTDSHVPATADEQALLEQLDMLLNDFEHVIYLENERHLTKRDRQAVFEYWFDLMQAPDRAAIRRYAAWFGFERVAYALDCQTPDYVAVYGSLRKHAGIGDEPDLSTRLKSAGTAIIEGKLIDLGDYPGLIPGAGDVQAELFEVVDHEAFEIMDRHERCDPTDVEGSLYLRRAVRLLQPSVDAWVYVYNREVGDAPEVPGGNWIEYLASRATFEPVEQGPR